MPVETIERLMGLGAKARFIRGNADRELVAAYDQGPGLPGDPLNPGRQAVAWVASCLERPHRDFLATFEEYVIIEVTGIGQVVFCHGPRAATRRSSPLQPRTRSCGRCLPASSSRSWCAVI